MPIDPILLKRFFDGHCTAEEEEKAVGWLLDPQNQEEAKLLMREQWEACRGDDVEVDIDRLLSKTLSRMDREKAGARRGGERKVKKVKWFRSTPARVAAAILLMAAAAAIFLQFPAGETGLTGKMHLAVRTHHVRTSAGQIIMKVLPDGTKVWLNAGSKLEYPVSFGETRNVTLEGEAFFDVAEDKEHPFIVQADGLRVKVLGTAFNVKSYPDDPAVTTTLLRGKVVIEEEQGRDDRKIELQPNQQAVFSHASEAVVLSNVNAVRYTSWKDGNLVFEDEQVSDVLKTLERWYGVTITVPEGTNLSCRLTARIDKETLNETLELLRTITGMHYSVDGDEVVIEGSVCLP